MPTGFGSRPTCSCSHPSGARCAARSDEPNASGNTAMLEVASCGTQRQARCRRRAPRRRGEGFRGEAPWLQFTNLIDAALDLPMQEKNASPEKDGTECTNKPERWVRVDGRRERPLTFAFCRTALSA